MLDSKSLDTISKFKQSLLTKSLPTTINSQVLTSNRGKKLDFELTGSKVVDYDGVEYLVTSNSNIEYAVNRNKRKWYEASGKQSEFDDQENNSNSNEVNDDDYDDYDYENPLDFGITDILSAINHPSDLFCHPAILRTYKLTILDNLAGKLIELIEVEQKTLNYFNKLLQVLNGEDWYYLLEDNLGLPSYDHGLTNEEKQNEIKDNIPEAMKPVDGVNDTEKEKTEDIPKRITRTHDDDDEEVQDPFFKLPTTLEKYEFARTKLDPENQELKLDLINYLQISTQRQQEYIKNLTDLRMNIVRANRLKETLLKWGKEMYDKK